MKEELVKLYREYLEEIRNFNIENNLIMGKCHPSFEGFMFYLEHKFIES